MKTLYKIYNLDGAILYTNLSRSNVVIGYDWGDGHGHVTDSTIKFQKWKVVEQYSYDSDGNCLNPADYTEYATA